MTYQAVKGKVNYFQELKKMLKIETFSFRPDGATSGKYIFCCFKDKLPVKSFLLEETDGIIVRENGKTVMIFGDGPKIVGYLKKAMEYTH